MKQDYYDTLGVSKGADSAEIKQAYRRMAMKYHPDRNPNDKSAEDKFKSAQEAYAVLSDAEKKSAYDRFGHAAFQHGGGGGGGGGGGAQDFSSVFDDLFSDFFSGGGVRASSRRQRVISVQLSFEESITGCKKELRINEPAVCSDCGGSGGSAGHAMKTCNKCRGAGQIRINRGFFNMQQTCDRCNGRGKIFEKPCGTCGGEGQRRIVRTIAVQIPAGIQEEETIRINVPEFVDQFHLQVHVTPHPLFTRDGDNLHLVIPISITVAALGGHVEAPLPGGGRVKITIPPETQSGAVLRLRGRGAPNVRGRGVGDMLCHVAVETPVNLTDAQKKLLHSFDDSLRKKQERHSPNEQSWLNKVRSFFDE